MTGVQSCALPIFIQCSYQDSLREIAQVELDGIHLAESLERPGNIAVVNVGNRVNTRNSEATPVPVDGDELYFVSFGEERLLQEGEDVNRQAQIFTAKMNSEGRFTRKAQALEDLTPEIGRAHV